MSKNANITLNDEVFEDLGKWCAKNGKMRRSTAISFMVTQWLQSQKTVKELSNIMQQVLEAQKNVTEQQKLIGNP